MTDPGKSDNIVFEFPCEPRLLDFRIVFLFGIQLVPAIARGLFDYLSTPNKESYHLGLRFLWIVNIVGYILLIPLAYYIFNLFNKPLRVNLFEGGIEFKFLLGRAKFVQYNFVKEIAKEERIEHLTLTFANKKRIALSVGSLPLEMIDQFIAELQKRNPLLKYCFFDTSDNSLT